jgi:hypothetical protein
VSSRDELSRLLAFVRGERTQMEAAALTGLSQAKISRAERGRFPLSAEEAALYAERLGATAEQRERLIELAAARSAEHVSGRVALVRVAAAVQERIERYQRDATVIRAWQPNLVPGVLQTPEYTEALLAGDGEGDPGPAWWSARRARTAMLSEPGRSWHLLVSEAAVRWPLGSAETMRAQIEHLVAVSELPGVRLGVLDLATPKPFARRPPLSTCTTASPPSPRRSGRRSSPTRRTSSTSIDCSPGSTPRRSTATTPASYWAGWHSSTSSDHGMPAAAPPQSCRSLVGA